MPPERSYAACAGVLSGKLSGGGTVSELAIRLQLSLAFASKENEMTTFTK
ncbi:methyltransferase, partial [Escherichia coli]